MNLQEMIDAINRRVDDVVSTPDAVEWLNSGKDEMAIAVGASFPDLVVSSMTSSYPFDSKYHEGPVLYAAASFKEQDSALSEVANFMMKYENKKKEFVRFYVVPPRYRDDRISQQFRAIAGQTLFSITKDGYSPAYGDAKVYVNDKRAVWTPGTLNDFILTTPATLDDYVTVIWEEHTDLIEPPYNWWTW